MVRSMMSVHGVGFGNGLDDWGVFLEKWVGRLCGQEGMAG